MISAVCDATGRRWRVEGPGWTMQPEGTLTFEEAEAICRTTAHALTLNAAVTDTTAVRPALRHDPGTGSGLTGQAVPADGVVRTFELKAW